MLRSRSFGGNDITCEWDALTAAGALAELGISGARTIGPGPHGIPYFLFPNRIADADDHRNLALRCPL